MSQQCTYQETGYCNIPASFDNVAFAAQKLQEFCISRGLSEEKWMNIEFPFCEAVNNAVEHGCAEDESKTVSIHWTWDQSRLEIAIEDPGHFNPSIEDTPELPDDILSESGRGNFIIQSMADDYQHEATENGDHRLTLKFNLGEEQLDLLNKIRQLNENLNLTKKELEDTVTHASIFQGMAEDLADSPVLNSIIRKGIDRIKGAVESPTIHVWSLEKDQLINSYHTLPEPEGKQLQSVPIKSYFSISNVFMTQEEYSIEDCATLPFDDPMHASDSIGVVTPIVFQGESIGVISLSTTSKHLADIPKISGLLRVFAKFLGIAFIGATISRQHEEQKHSQAQLEVAADIQRSLLPKNYPNNHYCRTTGRCEAAQAVGGDYIDLIEIRDVGILFVIADVMGKGVPAALLATIFRTAIRSRLNLAETPGWLLTQINKQIHKELGHLNMFITAQAAFLTYDKNKLKLANAGHCPVLHLDEERKEVYEWLTDGMPLGIDPDDIYEEKLIEVKSGDKIMFITDGITEAENRRGEMLGLNRVTSRLPVLWKGGIDNVTDNVFNLVEKHCAGYPSTDDRTMMALEII